jgi:hypothetical protein
VSICEVMRPLIIIGLFIKSVFTLSTQEVINNEIRKKIVSNSYLQNYCKTKNDRVSTARRGNKIMVTFLRPCWRNLSPEMT